MEESEKLTGIIGTAADAGVKKAAENVVNRGLNALIDFVKNRYGNARIVLGTAFERYLSNATLRYNQVRTLATGDTPRTIIGSGSFYEKIGVMFRDKYIETSTVDALLRISTHILISGTGGTGKSILMRYLFLNTADRGEYVPVLLELRKASNLDDGKISVVDLIFNSLSDFDVDLPRDQFEYSLRLGKYLFLFDGFDEVKESNSLETAAAIQSFCSKYPQNPCILTSRPNEIKLSPFETFTIMNTTSLTKSQAVSLSSKIWDRSEKTAEFCKRLDEEYFDKLKDFAENPLLLTMMFLTYMHNGEIPENLADFYQKSFDALYNAHDNRDKGVFRRDFSCKIEENEFKRLFSHFCFQTFFKEKYEFRDDEILAQINSSAKKAGVSGVKPEAYRDDLCNAVCMMVKDGLEYHFSHRSFQTYFAALYTSKLPDDQQKRLFDTILSKSLYWENEDYYSILSQLEPDRFLQNALEKKLRRFLVEAESSHNPFEYILFRLFNQVAVRPTSFSKKKDNEPDRIVYTLEDNNEEFNVFELFRGNYMKEFMERRRKGSLAQKVELAAIIQQLIMVHGSVEFSQELALDFHDFSTIFDQFPDKQEELIGLMIEDLDIRETVNEIRSVFSSIDKKRNALKDDNFIEDL